MSNIKVVYDCEKNTTSYIPLSAAEIAHQESLTALSVLEQQSQAIEAPQETPAE